MDMTESIAPKSDQMNAEDLLSGPRTFTIVEIRPGSSNEQPVSVVMAEFPKARPFKPSKTVRRIMVYAWGPDSVAHIGERMTLYRDPDVKFGGQDVGGIRVSHMSGITKRLEVALAVTKGRRAMYVVEPLPADAPVSAGPSPFDELVWALNEAGIGAGDRLEYCRNIVQRDIGSATDLTADEVAAIIDRGRTAPPGGIPDPDGLEPSDDERARYGGDSS